MDITSATVLHTRLLARARLRHLQLLVKLAELGNLKRSAEALHLSQPAATQLLADLEALLEIRLFDRHSRGVRITPAGDALLPAARRAVEALADGAEVLTALKQQGEGLVRTAALTGAIAGLLVRALPVWAREHPGVQIQLHEAEADRCVEGLVRQTVDLALCREPAVLPDGLHFTPLLPDRFVVAAGVEHPLAWKRRVPWASLAQERWLLPPVQSAARKAFDDQFAALGTVPAVSPVVTRVSAMTWAMLQSDRLLTLVPFGVVRQLVEAGHLAVVDASPALPFAPIGLLSSDAVRSAAADRFARFLQRFARQHP